MTSLHYLVKYQCPVTAYMMGHCFLKYKLARDMTYGRQQLLWQTRVTVIGSIDLDSHVNCLAIIIIHLSILVSQLL